jgi:hypothetical protein
VAFVHEKSLQGAAHVTSSTCYKNFHSTTFISKRTMPSGLFIRRTGVHEIFFQGEVMNSRVSP